MRIKASPDHIGKLKRAHPQANVNAVGTDEYIVSGIDDNIIKSFGTPISTFSPLQPPEPLAQSAPVQTKSESEITGTVGDLYKGFLAFENQIKLGMQAEIEATKAKFTQQLESFPKMLSDVKNELQKTIDTSKAALDQQLQTLRASIASAHQQMEQAKTEALKQIADKTQEIQNKLDTLAKRLDMKDTKDEKEAIAFAAMFDNVKKAVLDFTDTIGVHTSNANICSSCGRSK